MKASYPVEAFLFAIAIFSTSMKEAFVSGSLLLVAAVASLCCYQILRERVPQWSSKVSVILLGGTICAGSYEVAFYYLEIPFSDVQWMAALFLGILCGVSAMKRTCEYEKLIWESSICFAFFLLLSIVREYSSISSVFGYSLDKFLFESKAFVGIAAGCIVASIGVGMTHASLKIKEEKGISYWLFMPLFFLYAPMKLSGLPEGAAFLLGISFAALCFWSICKRIRFSDTGTAMQGVPIQFLSVGFLYMILSAF